MRAVPAALAMIVGLMPALSQASEGVHKGSVAHIKVHGKSLEGNLLGDSPDRNVAVYLPPSYASSGPRRYPVVYLLHGFGGTDKTWLNEAPAGFRVQDGADRAFAASTAQEMILVAPDAHMKFDGSYYGSSVTTGDWETYLTKDLVAYVDSHYRTIANRMSRGLAGHSMGGYGTMRLGMKYPDVYSSIYAMSACCLAQNTIPVPTDARWAAMEAVKSMADQAKAEFGVRVGLAEAASWSPNPDNPPFYFDLPVKGGQVQLATVARWMANSPMVMVDQYVYNLRSLEAIGLEIGEQDERVNPATVRALDELLTRRNIRHTFDTYEGTHGNKIAERFEKKALPFFTKNLKWKE